MRLLLPFSILVLPLFTTGNPIDPVPSAQEFLTDIEDTSPLTANKWELKPYPDNRCTGDSVKTFSGISTNACTVLADKPSNSFRFFSTKSSFKVCFYNQKGCAKEHFCGKNDGGQRCWPFGAKGPAVAFKIVNKGEKCIEGGPVIGEDHDSEEDDELDVEFVEL